MRLQIIDIPMEQVTEIAGELNGIDYAGMNVPVFGFAVDMGVNQDEVLYLMNELEDFDSETDYLVIMADELSEKAYLNVLAHELGHVVAFRFNEYTEDAANDIAIEMLGELGINPSMILRNENRDYDAEMEN